VRAVGILFGTSRQASRRGHFKERIHIKMTENEKTGESAGNDLCERIAAQYTPGVPGRFNFAYDVMDRKAATNSRELALIHLDEHGHRRDYDYGYFAEESSKFAHALKEAGIRRGDRVMLILYRRVEFWSATLALHKLGAVVIPGSFLLTESDILERVKFGSIACIIAERGLTKKVDAVKAACPSLRLLVDVADDAATLPGWRSFAELCAGRPNVFPRPEICPGGKDPMLVFFTSGTTGMPKMVEHDYEYPLGHIMTAYAWHDLKPGDIHLTVSDTGWGKAMWGKFYGQWMAGAVVFVFDFRDKFIPMYLLREISRNNVTTLCAPPTVFRVLAREDLALIPLDKLRHCTTAGEAMNPSVAEMWKKKTGLSIYEGYGQTETTLLVATFPGMKIKPGVIGKPVPGWNLTLLDYDDKPCAAGEEGEICIDVRTSRPRGLFTGYANDPERTAEAFRNGFYHTGDRASMDSDGYITFLGRIDDVIKSAGYRIGPFEVENALISHEAVLEAAVTGVADDLRGQVVKATVVLAPGFKPSRELTMDIQRHVKKCTAPYKYPRIVEYVDSLPKTVSGKIKRAEIRANDTKRGIKRLTAMGSKVLEKLGLQAGK
jgi:acetyl-CoA synthetase